MKRDLRMAGLVAAALAGIALGIVLVLGLLAGNSPEGRAMAESLLPEEARAPRSVRRAQARLEEAAGGALTVQVVDVFGQAVAGLVVAVRACSTATSAPGSWSRATADRRGRATLSGSGCLELAVEGEGWLHLGPPGAFASESSPDVQALVARRCPGEVVVTNGADPVSGQVVVEPRGRAQLDERGRAWFDELLCAPTGVDVSVDGRWHRFEDRVVQDGVLRIELGEGELMPLPGEREVTVHLSCTNCPDQVRAASGAACSGEGQLWVCPCLAQRACPIEGWWQEVLFDWRFVKEEIARVPPEVDEFHIDLSGYGIAAVGRWLGPMPCAARATHGETGAERWARCLPDGTFWLPDLRTGTHELEVGWTPDGSPIGQRLGSITTRFEVHDEDLDLGELAP